MGIKRHGTIQRITGRLLVGLFLFFSALAYGESFDRWFPWIYRNINNMLVDTNAMAWVSANSNSINYMYLQTNAWDIAATWVGAHSNDVQYMETRTNLWDDAITNITISPSNAWAMIELDANNFRLDYMTNTLVSDCRFVARKNTGQLMVATGNYLMTWEVEDLDVGNDFDLANNRFTAPRAGNYLIGGLISMMGLNDQGTFALKIQTSTGTIRYFGENTVSGTSKRMRLNGSIFLPLASGEHVQIYLEQGQAGITALGANYDSSFWGFEVE